MYEITLDEKEKVDSIGEKSGFDGEKSEFVELLSVLPTNWEVVLQGRVGGN